jgi:hypothetical protein
MIILVIKLLCKWNNPTVNVSVWPCIKHKNTRYICLARSFRTSILLIFVFSHFYKLITYHGNLKLTIWRSISVFDARKIMCNHNTTDQDILCKISLFPLQSFNYKAPAHFWLFTWTTSDIETIMTCNIVYLIVHIFIHVYIHIYTYI